MRLLYRKKDKIWYCESEYTERHIPKSAGFRWTTIITKKWATKSPAVARKLIEFADEEAIRALESTKKERANATPSSKIKTSITVPAPAGKNYMQFQKAGIDFAIRKNNTLIADEMGLGKTIQAIGYINYINPTGKILIVCPASLKQNWYNELQEWLVQKRTVRIAKTGIDFLADIIIVNYSSLDKYKQDLLATLFDIVIADEIHYCKSPKAKRSKAFYEIVENIETKIYLTGTPILNRPIEIQPIVKSLGCDFAQSRWRFAKKYCNLHKNHWGWDLTGASNLAELRQLLTSTVMIRRLKEDVLSELPAKRRQIIELPPDKETETLIEKESIALQTILQQTGDYNEVVNRLKSGGVGMINEISQIRKETALKKIPLALLHINNVIESGEKVAVFAHHREVINTLSVKLRLKHKGVVITGETPQEYRQELVNLFQSDDECKFFIGSIKAAGVGITLTKARIAVFLELDWSPGNIQLAEDRIHRIGQKDACLIQYIVYNKSIDGYIAKMLKDKQSIINQSLNNNKEV